MWWYLHKHIKPTDMDNHLARVDSFKWTLIQMSALLPYVMKVWSIQTLSDIIYAGDLTGFTAFQSFIPD